MPVYQLPDGSWLVDDSTIPFPPPSQTVDAPAAARAFLTQRSLAAPQQRLVSPMLNEADIPLIPDYTNSPPQDTPAAPYLLSPDAIPANGTFWMLVETN